GVEEPPARDGRVRVELEDPERLPRPVVVDRRDDGVGDDRQLRARGGGAARDLDEAGEPARSPDADDLERDAGGLEARGRRRAAPVALADERDDELPRIDALPAEAPVELRPEERALLDAEAPGEPAGVDVEPEDRAVRLRDVGLLPDASAR